ncbi:MAG: glycosyltransferase [Candidatus Micrarchaeota archaeon]
MKVSVIIPTLNEEARIETVLKSVKGQEYGGDVEIIVADGNSTDRTVEIAQKYCDKVVKETTRTIAAGRQAGCGVAGGEYFLFIDADCIADSHWISSMVRAFEKNNAVAVYGLIVPNEGSSLERAVLGIAARFASGFSNVLGIDYLAGSNMAVRRKEFEKIGGFNIYLTTGEDTELIKRMRHEGKVVFAPDAIVGYAMRRIRSWGYPRYIWFHTKNFFSSHFLGKPAEHYAPIREKK